MTDKEDKHRLEQVEPAAIESVIGGPVLPMDRYHLRTPIFSGEEDVEQFSDEFSDLVAICRWPAWVTMIQLWLILMKSAIPYGIGQDVGEIFDVL